MAPSFPALLVSSPALWSHTHCAPSRCSDLGVSGLRNPGPNPRPSPTLRQDRPGSRGRSSPPPALDSELGNPEGREGEGARRLETPPPGDTLQPELLCAPSSPSPTLGGRDGRGACRWTLVGRAPARLEANPRGEKLGGGRQEGDSGPAGAAGEALRSPAGPPARVPGWAAAAPARTGSARGSGHRAQARRPRGRDPRIPRAPPPSRLRRSARAPGLGGRRGLGLGGGVGGGPCWARPGARAPGWLRPERRAPDSARGARPHSGRKSWAPARRTPRMTWERPAAESGPRGHDRRAQTRHTRGYTHSHPETLCYSHLRLRGQANTLAHARYTLPHMFTDVGTLPQPSPLCGHGPNTDIRRHPLS